MSHEHPKTRLHPVHVVHRMGAAVLGVGLWIFAGLGFANGLAFFSTQGQIVLGLSSNGLLSTVSLVAGAVLLATAAWRGPMASTATAVIGVAFLVSGLGHLAVLNTPLNILAFQLPNVFFSLIAGMILLFLGMYGRLTGGLPPDNPYRQARESHHDRPDEETATVLDKDSTTKRALVDAELAMAEGHPSAEQQALVEYEQRRLREHERERIRQNMRGRDRDEVQRS